jgi:sec-independent protein translocase protein TatA
MTPLVADIGTPELLIVLAVIVLFFGAAKLPDLARGSGRALRIFRAEMKGEDEVDEKPVEPVVAKPAEPIVAKPAEPIVAKPAEPTAAKPAEPDA